MLSASKCKRIKGLMDGEYSMTPKQLELLRFVAQVLLDNRKVLSDSTVVDISDLMELLSNVEQEAFRS